MARFLAAPRLGHLENVLHIFAYFKKHLESKLVFDPARRDFANINLISHDWKLFYPDIQGRGYANWTSLTTRKICSNKFLL
jgi:hypothetical protein